MQSSGPAEDPKHGAYAFSPKDITTRICVDNDSRRMSSYMFSHAVCYYPGCRIEEVNLCVCLALCYCEAHKLLDWPRHHDFCVQYVNAIKGFKWDKMACLMTYLPLWYETEKVAVSGWVCEAKGCNVNIGSTKKADKFGHEVSAMLRVFWPNPCIYAFSNSHQAYRAVKQVTLCSQR